MAMVGSLALYTVSVPRLPFLEWCVLTCLLMCIGGGKEPPSSGQQVDEEEEPDEEQVSSW